MPRTKTLASAPSPDLVLTSTGGALSSPDVVLYERGNEYKNADGTIKMTFKGNKVEIYGLVVPE